VNRPTSVLAIWGGMLTVLGVMLVFFEPSQLTWALLIGAAISLAPSGALMLFPGRRDERPLPDTSLPTVAIALGFCVLILGLAAGAWLAALGVELVALGAFGLFRELRAQRRANRS
jgi:hypothetical protein